MNPLRGFKPVFILFYYNSETSTRYGQLLIILIKFPKHYLIKNNHFLKFTITGHDLLLFRHTLYKTISLYRRPPDNLLREQP